MFGRQQNRKPTHACLLPVVSEWANECVISRGNVHRNTSSHCWKAGRTHGNGVSVVTVSNNACERRCKEK